MQSNVRSSGVVFGLAALAHGAASALAGGDAAVQWRVADGGNGHWYAIRVDQSASWDAGADLANERGAHLASISSSAENAFVRALALATPGAFVAVDFGPFLGGLQQARKGAIVEPAGSWVWSTGEPWQYTNWLNTEPNNYACVPGASPENFVQMYRNGFWNDAASMPDDCGQRLAVSYAFEWSADCDGDGAVDYGQILAGEREDSNGNNIPDCCEQGVLCDPCGASDVVENGLVDAVDLSALVNVWGTDGGQYPRADIDRNGLVNGADLAILLSNWGACGR
jgi:hypothetical protein